MQVVVVMVVVGVVMGMTVGVVRRFVISVVGMSVVSVVMPGVIMSGVIMPAAAGMAVRVVLLALTMMQVRMPMPISMMVFAMVPDLGLPLEPRVAATAYRAHQITSMSLIRISSPPSGISLPPPHVGQGSSRFSISTCAMQS